jgi:hypothetical protein
MTPTQGFVAPPEKEALNDRIMISINALDKKQLQAEALRFGIRAVGTYCRNLILGKMTRPIIVPGKKGN